MAGKPGKLSPFAMTTPCATCPFRTDLKGGAYLTQARAESIRKEVSEQGRAFHCHKTVDYDRNDGDSRRGGDASNAAWCAGALIVSERSNAPNQSMRIGERLGLYDPTKLDQGAPVYADWDAFVEDHDGL